MWKCNNCGEEITKDKYKVCWNCGTPKVVVNENKQAVERTPPKLSPPIKKEIKPAAKVEIPPEIKSPPIPKETETSPKTQIIQPDEFLSQYKPTKEKSNLIAGKIIFPVLWLAAVSAIGYFAYIAYQKTAAFENKIAAEFQNFNAQKAQFVFPPIPILRRGTVIDGNVRAKVLPLNVKMSETDALFKFLPDDLRPANLDDVKTFLWLDCENNAVGRYRDGTTGFQEKCTAYLVEKETNKFIGIQDFLGVMPALAKEKAGEDAIGKVMPEKYVSYLREKQIESERGLIQNSSESPDHHIYTKSEFIYSLLLLGLLAAIGLGWVAFNLKFNRRTDK